MAFKKVNENTPFSKAVIKMVAKIPKGKIATYGQIAKISGNAGGSRGVAWILHACSKKYKLPWQRVINSQGKISFDKSTKEYKNQKNLLIKEGIQFSDTGTVNLKTFQWGKKTAPKRKIPASISGASVSKVKPKMFG
ncbi:DNA methyltransferase [Bdellovibrio sp. qaytius]|nr:DNA methyltransferase [Bdellovibrio sp. qaytius]